jgi:hypothetical protein
MQKCGLSESIAYNVHKFVLKVVEKFVFNCEEEIFNWILGGKASEREREKALVIQLWHKSSFFFTRSVIEEHERQVVCRESLKAVFFCGYKLILIKNERARENIFNYPSSAFNFSSLASPLRSAPYTSYDDDDDSILMHTFK